MESKTICAYGLRYRGLSTFVILSLLSRFIHGGAEQGQHFEFFDSEILRRGEVMLNMLDGQASTVMVANNSCWKSAVDDLKTSCKFMTEMQQRLIALRLANCHLRSSGLPSYSCTTDTFMTCSKEMAESSPLAFYTYTEFFAKVIDICYYVKSDLWREKTEEVVNNLSQTSDDVVSKLEEAAGNQEKLLNNQHLSMENQEKILQSSESIQEAVDKSAREAAAEFAAAKKRAEEQSEWLDNAFNRTFGYLDPILRTMDFIGNYFIYARRTLIILVGLVTLWFFSRLARSVAKVLVWFCLVLMVSIWSAQMIFDNGDSFKVLKDWIVSMLQV